jgi:hypothetical protein
VGFQIQQCGHGWHGVFPPAGYQH